MNGLGVGNSFTSSPKAQPSDNGKPEFSGVESYLVLIDKDWNILAEVALGTWPKAPSRHFVKDGKIWMFENIEDEMGFVVMGLSK